MAIKDYDDAKARAVDFIKTFAVNAPSGVKEFVYSDQVASISRRRQVALYIKMDHILEYDADLAAAIEHNTVRYQKIFGDVVDDYIKELLGENEVYFLNPKHLITRLLATSFGRSRCFHFSTPLHGSQRT